MKIRICALTLAFSLILIFSGCSSIFAKEYSVEEEFAGGMQPGFSSSMEITNYSGLKAAIYNLVISFEDEGRLKFLNYPGDVKEDLGMACREVSGETAIGAFAVDYITSEVNWILTYYEAGITIKYQRTKEQLDSVETAYSEQAFIERIAEAITERSEYLAVRINAVSLATQNIDELMENVFYGHPGDFVVLPEYQYNVFPEGGVQRIYEFILAYDIEAQKLSAMAEELKEALLAVSEAVLERSYEEAALKALEYVAESCDYDPTGEIRLARFGDDIRPGETAYGALVQGCASSQGIAMAFAAVCRDLGIDCEIISGKLDREEHSWNILTFEDGSYHVDVSLAGELGAAAVFMKNDAEMWGRYWWDIGKYKPCEGTRTYFDVVDGK